MQPKQCHILMINSPLRGAPHVHRLNPWNPSHNSITIAAGVGEMSVQKCRLIYVSCVFDTECIKWMNNGEFVFVNRYISSQKPLKWILNKFHIWGGVIK